jgi:hypothetical protein
MNTPWIMFYNNGQVVVDVTIKFGAELKYPYGEYYITPRYGKVPVDNVIEVRGPERDALRTVATGWCAECKGSGYITVHSKDSATSGNVTTRKCSCGGSGRVRLGLPAEEE